MIQEIDEKVQDVKTLILQFNTERRQWEEYLVELDQRLASAKKSIKHTEQKLREIHLQDEYNILAEQGKAKRSKLLARIGAQKDLLQSFLQSPLLTDAEKHMEEELALQRAEASNPLDQASAKLGRVNAPTRRKMLSKEEMEAYKISMRDAISTLVEKMEEVGTLV
jgi:chromosome segregation ATPase